MTITVNKYPLLYKILENAKWKGTDDFPADELWASEHEKWLEFVISKNQLNRFLPRLTKQDSRKKDEAFAEINSAYFLEAIQGFPISEWEPTGVGRSKGDFLLNVNSIFIFCEVKSPGWEAEIISSQGFMTPRLSLPKYINGEVKGVDNSIAIRNAIDKDYKDLSSDKPTLLIFNDDLWFSVFNEISVSDSENLPLSIYRALYYEPLPPPYTDTKPTGYFKTDLYKHLSGILFLNVINNGQIRYKYAIFENHMALNKLPNEMIQIGIGEYTA